MKVLERVLEKKIRCQVSSDNMQFGFMPGKGITDAIFIMQQVQEKHQAKKKKLYYAFVDLEKAFNTVPREVMRWALRKLDVDEWLIRTVMALYTVPSEARSGLPSELLYADDLVLMAPTMEQLGRRVAE